MIARLYAKAMPMKTGVSPPPGTNVLRSHVTEGKGEYEKTAGGPETLQPALHPGLSWLIHS